MSKDLVREINGKIIREIMKQPTPGKRPYVKGKDKKKPIRKNE